MCVYVYACVCVCVCVYECVCESSSKLLRVEYYVTESIVVVFLYVDTPPPPHPLSFCSDDPLDASFIVNRACVVYHS